MTVSVMIKFLFSSFIILYCWHVTFRIVKFIILIQFLYDLKKFLIRDYFLKNNKIVIY